MYRFNDGYLSSSSLLEVAKVAEEDILQESAAINYTIILARYFVRLKIEQQKISSLTSTDNKTIKNNAKTLLTVKNALMEYNELLKDANSLMGKLLFKTDEMTRKLESEQPNFIPS